MISTKFNPLTYANDLKNAGLDQKVAEVIAMNQSKVIDEIITDHLATKEDLKNLEIRMYAFIVKSVTTTILALGGLQTLFHFFK